MVNFITRTKSNKSARITGLLTTSNPNQRALIFVAIFALIGGGILVFSTFAASAPISTYYPNASRYTAGYYLEGHNYTTSPASRSVFWFQAQSDGSFKQFNSAPYDTCHWDQLSWKTGTLVYSKTHDQCGANNNEISYSPGIKFMPSNWNTGQTWGVNGSSMATYYNHSVIACKGNNTWTSKVIGWEQVAPGVQGLHIQNNQSISWTYGSDPSGCKAGHTTKWQENFYLVAGLPVNGATSTDYALKREVGGNVDTFSQTGKWDYDVWFDSWNHLP